MPDIPVLPPVTTRPLWVFGYGSLIWNPDFPVAERRIARLDGWHRSFCMSSIHHRGTPERPGLVLALDASENAACHGVAFRVAEGAEDVTVTALRERELISSAYIERLLAVEIEGIGPATVLAYVIDRDHEQYRGDLSLEEQAQIIAGATGGRGPNDTYLENTAAHLHELGLPDPDLDWLVARVRRLKNP
ncbi:gamma-glutamylcyclotransferase [Rhodobacterales bacterium HKCCE3408]|nr:gamma-glutamylcyclotransferase [Rhodobacterales bacterium HKCCE3408]